MKGFEHVLVPEPSERMLNQRQFVDYRNHREQLIRWMATMGKNSAGAEGYAETTVIARARHTDAFYRWVWSEEQAGGYTTDVDHDDTDEYIHDIAYCDVSNTHKTNVSKTLKMYWRWREYEFGDDAWKPSMTFSQPDTTAKPRDFLTRKERRKVREAALEYGSIPHYNSVSPAERREWNRYLSLRFRKPMDEIGTSDWKRANGFKIASLVWVSLDAGLRPIEVERATVRWVDTENAVLRIPKEESAKSEWSWIVSLQDRTAEILGKWLEERRLYEKYENTDALWLTREANPYQSTALKFVLRNLCEQAGIPIENRQMTWYSIRHSVGTYMSREEGLAAAQSQLRHTSPKTTMKYDNAPVEDRRDALNRMG